MKFIYYYFKVMDDLKQRRDLNATAKLVFGLLLRLMNLSWHHGTKYYDDRYCDYYVNYKLDDLAKDCGTTKYAVRKGMNLLSDAGLIYEIPAWHKYRIFMPRFYCPPETKKRNSESNLGDKSSHHSELKSADSQHSKFSHHSSFEPTHHSSFNTRLDRRAEKGDVTGNTVNTEKACQKRFGKYTEMDDLDDWVSSVTQHAGLTHGAGLCVARFCNHCFPKNSRNRAWSIYHNIMIARGAVLKHYYQHSRKHLDKATVSLEGNDNIRDGLESRLRKVFKRVVSKDYRPKTLNLHHYGAYLVASLKNFFHTAFGLDKQTRVRPQTQIQSEPQSSSQSRPQSRFHAQRTNGYGGRARKPIKEGMSDCVAHDNPSQAKPTGKTLTALCTARLKLGKERDQSHPNQEKIEAYKKRIASLETKNDAELARQRVAGAYKANKRPQQADNT